MKITSIGRYGRGRINSVGLATSLSISSLCLLPSCGPDTNLMQIFADDDGVDSLLVRARAAYDRGDLSDAAKFAEKALKQDPENEGGAVILGYISLGQGGMDSFSLLKKLLSLGGSGNNLVAAQSKLTGNLAVDIAIMAEAIARDGQGGANPEPVNMTTTAGGSVTSTLDNLSDLVSLSEAEVDSLGAAYTDGTAYGRTFFADYPLVEPAAVNQTLRAEVPFLGYMNRVPDYLCGFIADTVRDEDDPRDSLDTCPVSARRSTKRVGSIHLIWAFSHIGEALAYQKILNYSTGSSASSGVSNLQGRVTKYKNTNFGNTSNMVDASNDLIDSIDVVFPDPGSIDGISQLNATLSAMNSASQAFAAMSSGTQDISKGISDSMSALKTTANTISGSGSEGSKATKALKGQFTEAAVQALKAQIETSGDTSLCDDFNRLAGNTPGITKPSGC